MLSIPMGKTVYLSVIQPDLNRLTEHTRVLCLAGRCRVVSVGPSGYWAVVLTALLILKEHVCV